ncbi:hypothetical protein AGMMS49944_09750 [Spirochaetia bacterium]|nr:hypothetical protein AGMMS49944_09750 [Spirochaetia bacterium]
MINLDGTYSPHTEQGAEGYPGGKAIPATEGGRTDGTPIRSLLVNTIIGFFQSIIVEGEGSYKVSGNPDRVGNSDLLKALKKIAKAAKNPDFEQRIKTLEELAEALVILQEILPSLVHKAPSDDRLYGYKNNSWAEVVIPEFLIGEAVKLKKFYSDSTIMFTNATADHRRLKHCDIGLPFISPASEVYHFDTDLKNHNGGNSITVGYATAPALVGREDTNGGIYMNPAVSDSPPYEPDGKSLFGSFDIKTKIPSQDATIEFWLRVSTIQNVSVFRLRIASGEELIFNIGGPDPNYSAAAVYDIPYSVMGDEPDDNISYSVATLTQNRLEHITVGAKESINLASSINANTWIHIALVATTQKLSLYIDTTKIDVVKQNQALQDIDVTINEDRDEINIDELTIDRTTALAAAAFYTNTEKYIPYGALDYMQKWSVVMFDNPNRVYTNLFESEQFKMAVKAAINNSHD